MTLPHLQDGNTVDEDDWNGTVDQVNSLTPGTGFGTWLPLSLSAGWVNHNTTGSDFPSLSYTVVLALNAVAVVGVIRRDSGTVGDGNIIATLPIGVRPGSIGGRATIPMSTIISNDVAIRVDIINGAITLRQTVNAGDNIIFAPNSLPLASG